MDKQATKQAGQKAARGKAYRDREQRWRGHLKAWGRSGWSQAEYCRRRGLAAADFSWWKGELARRDAESRRKAEEVSTARFVPVQVIAGNGGNAACEVILRNGRRMRVQAACEPVWIAQLATALEAVSPC
jgi:hypothetical protein